MKVAHSTDSFHFVWPGSASPTRLAKQGCNCDPPRSGKDVAVSSSQISDAKLSTLSMTNNAQIAAHAGWVASNLEVRLSLARARTRREAVDVATPSPECLLKRVEHCLKESLYPHPDSPPRLVVLLWTIRAPVISCCRSTLSGPSPTRLRCDSMHVSAMTCRQCPPARSSTCASSGSVIPPHSKLRGRGSPSSSQPASHGHMRS